MVIPAADVKRLVLTLSSSGSNILPLKGKSSPISIVQSAAREISAQGSWPKDGSFGSAILRGVGFDSVGNGGSGSGPNSWTDDGRNNEIVALRKQVQDERRNQINVSQFLCLIKN